MHKRGCIPDYLVHIDPIGLEHQLKHRQTTLGHMPLDIGARHRVRVSACPSFSATMGAPFTAWDGEEEADAHEYDEPYAR